MENQPPDYPNERPWYKKKRYTIPIIFVGLIIILGGGDSPNREVNTEENVAPVSNPQLIDPIKPSSGVESFQAPAPKKEKPSSLSQNTSTSNPAIQEKKTEAPKPTPSKQNCNPNYSGCLMPDASDYDCAGGTGNGPYYTGSVQVIGYDEYGLDNDKDGWGCEKN